MSNCEMCGRKGMVVPADIDGVELSVCQNCSRYGKIKKSFSQPEVPKKGHFGYRNKEVQNKPLQKQGEVEYRIVKNFSSLIRNARNAKGMKQEEFSKLLNERESLVSKWESGFLIPPVQVARRIGHILNLKLIEIDDGDNRIESLDRSKADGEPTLGDFVKVRKRE